MQFVTADTLISDVLLNHPRAAEVFSRHGLACPNCLGASVETVSAVAAMHDVSVDRLLGDLNADAESLSEDRA